MSVTTRYGNCYICGQTINMRSGKTHVLKHHINAATEECALLKIEGAYNKNYCLFISIAKTAILYDLDVFLRNIWLECCNHMSIFSIGNHRSGTYQELEMNLKIGKFSVKDTILHKYDMGTTTSCLISFVGEISRQEQQNPVQLLIRNIPLQYSCTECGKPAEFVCGYCSYDKEDSCYCVSCGNKHKENCVGGTRLIPNSPRFGECGYDGEQDQYIFHPEEFS